MLEVWLLDSIVAGEVDDRPSWWCIDLSPVYSWRRWEKSNSMAPLVSGYWSEVRIAEVKCDGIVAFRNAMRCATATMMNIR